MPSIVDKIILTSVHFIFLTSTFEFCINLIIICYQFILSSFNVNIVEAVIRLFHVYSARHVLLLNAVFKDGLMRRFLYIE